MSRPAVVLFDLGKVLVDFDFTIAVRRILARSLHPPADVQVLLRTFPWLVPYERGEISSERFYEETCRAVGYQGGLEEFAGAFGDIFSAIPEMIRLQERVRAAGYPVWVFSNTNDLAIRQIRSQFPFFSNFDGFLLSYQLGMMKPAAGIYEAAERSTGRRGADILYLDDHEPNVAAGAARGWRAIRHTSPVESITALERVLQLEGCHEGGLPASP